MAASGGRAMAIGVGSGMGVGLMDDWVAGGAVGEAREVDTAVSTTLVLVAASASVAVALLVAVTATDVGSGGCQP